MKTIRIIYWITTGLLCALMLMSAGMYFFKNPMVQDTFVKLGYPTYVIYPLAIAKILGVITILTRVSEWLKEWAYAGFFFDFVLAMAAHGMIGDGGMTTCLVAIVLLFVSYFSGKRVFA